MKKTVITLFLLLSFVLSTQAQIKVASVLGDNMVLQRNSEVKIWGTASPNDKIIVAVGWNKLKINTVSNDKGEWLVKVKTVEAGGPHSITISGTKQKVTLKNILLGEVWLCSGQSNMEMTMLGIYDSPINGANETLFDADNNNIRMFTLKKASFTTPQDTCEGNWALANTESVSKFSAVGYFFARKLQRKLNVPVGIICSSWGGSRIEAWLSKDYLSKFPESLQSASQPKNEPQHRASQLYNGMINPIKNFVIKGALWYQGESNREWYQYYAGLMESMVENWRKDFGIGQFPFYFVQIAPYKYENSNDILSAKFCDEQLKASLSIPNCGMVCTIDIGEEDNIHPAEKETISNRLAYWAISETYGVKGINFKNTYFKRAVVRDSIISISFENIDMGLSTFGKQLSGFEIAGEDKVFYPAKAIIAPFRYIKVSAPEVKKPVAVRYRYHNFSRGDGYLYNTARLPIPSFRTDNW